jgi:hypothetical protein
VESGSCRRSALLVASNTCSPTAVTVTGGPLSPLTRPRAEESLRFPKQKTQNTEHDVASQKEESEDLFHLPPPARSLLPKLSLLSSLKTYRT